MCAQRLGKWICSLVKDTLMPMKWEGWKGNRQSPCCKGRGTIRKKNDSVGILCNVGNRNLKVDPHSSGSNWIWVEAAEAELDQWYFHLICCRSCWCSFLGWKSILLDGSYCSGYCDGRCRRRAHLMKWWNGVCWICLCSFQFSFVYHNNNNNYIW